MVNIMLAGLLPSQGSETAGLLLPMPPPQAQRPLGSFPGTGSLKALALCRLSRERDAQGPQRESGRAPCHWRRPGAVQVSVPGCAPEAAPSMPGVGSEAGRARGSSKAHQWSCPGDEPRARSAKHPLFLATSSPVHRDFISFAHRDQLAWVLQRDQAVRPARSPASPLEARA